MEFVLTQFICWAVLLILAVAINPNSTFTMTCIIIFNVWMATIQIISTITGL